MLLVNSLFCFSQQAPVLRSTTEMVLVPAVVTDSHDRPRSGLTCANFAIFDNGVEQQPVSCDEIAPRTAPPPALVRPETHHTNRPGQSGAQGLLIFALDFVNSPVGDVVRMRAAALRFLSSNAPPDQPIEVLALTWNGVRVIHPFTADNRVLLAAIDRVLKRDGHRSAGHDVDEHLVSIEANAMAGAPALDAGEDPHAPHSAHDDAAYGRAMQWHFVMPTLKNLEEIANGFAGVPGRKALLWASSGFPFAVPDPTSGLGVAPLPHLDYEFVEKYNQLWKTLNGANIAVYPVSLTGISGRSDYNYDASIRPPTHPANVSDSIPLYDREAQTKQTFLTFASATGGVACVENNDIAGCFRKAAADAQSYYLLTFRVDRSHAQPGWHKLKVRVNEAGSKVRARSAYFLQSAGAAPGQSPEVEQMLAARSQLQYTGVLFEVAWEQPQHPLHPSDVGFAVTIPPDGVPTSPSGPLNLRISAVPLGDSGPLLTLQDPIHLHLEEPAVSQFRQAGVSVHGQLALPPGCNSVKFLIRDESSGAIGSLEVPIKGT